MKKQLLFVTFLLIGIASLMLIRLNSTIFLDQQKLAYDNVNKLLNSVTQSLKQDALSFSLAATSFPTLKEAIVEKNQKTVNEILHEINDNLNKSFKSEKIEIQILTPEQLYCLQEHKTDKEYSHKNSTQALFKTWQQSNTPLIQTDNLITIRTPILEENRIVAFFEVKIQFDAIVQTMRKHKIEIIALLDKNKNSKEAFTSQNIFVNTHYFVSNENYNKTFLDKVLGLDATELQSLFKQEYLYKDGLFYALYDIRHKQGESLGKFIAIVNQTLFETMNNKKESFLRNIVTINSTSEDFYNWVKHQEENIFLNIEKGYIKNLKDVIDEKDKNEFEEMAREKLINLSKEELVDFILQQSKHSEIQGEIR